jgi:hypothetical protein
VQVIKPEPHRTGVLEFGTELIGSADNSIVALLGASLGASTSAFIATEMLEKCFGNERGRLPRHPRQDGRRAQADECLKPRAQRKHRGRAAWPMMSGPVRHWVIRPKPTRFRLSQASDVVATMKPVTCGGHLDPRTTAR